MLATTVVRPADLPQRLARRLAVDPATDCWEWTGPRYHDGYGMVYVLGSGREGNRRYARAHRVVYEAAVGPIPEGLVTDHLCRNKPCCNPAHLEPVTHAENMRRWAHSDAGRLAIANRPSR